MPSGGCCSHSCCRRSPIPDPVTGRRVAWCHLVRDPVASVRGRRCHVIRPSVGGYRAASLVLSCHPVLSPLSSSLRLVVPWHDIGRTREPFGSLGPQTAVMCHSPSTRDPPFSAHRSEILPLSLFFPVCEQFKKVGQPPFSTYNRKGSLAGVGYIIIFSIGSMPEDRG